MEAKQDMEQLDDCLGGNGAKAAATDSGGNSDDQCSIGYRRPPRKHRFQPGRSGNPKGRPKKTTNGLKGRFAAALEEEIKVPGKKRVRLSRLQALIRNVVVSAAEGEAKALNAVIWMSEIREGEPVASTPDWIVLSFSQALFAGTTKIFDDAYFRKQDQVFAERMKQLKVGGSLKGMVEKELARKVRATGADGKTKNVALAHLIVARFIAAAKNDPSALKALVRMVPEKKLKRDYSVVQVMRPTRGEYETLGESMPAWAPPPVDSDIPD